MNFYNYFIYPYRYHTCKTNAVLLTSLKKCQQHCIGKCRCYDLYTTPICNGWSIQGRQNYGVQPCFSKKNGPSFLEYKEYIEYLNILLMSQFTNINWIRLHYCQNICIILQIGFEFRLNMWIWQIQNLIFKKNGPLFCWIWRIFEYEIFFHTRKIGPLFGWIWWI